MQGEFFKLLQMVEAGRKCDGKECHVIRDSTVAQAVHNDSEKLHHLPTGDGDTPHQADCLGCVAIERQEIALRESLHTQGIDLPLEVLVDFTPPPSEGLR